MKLLRVLWTSRCVEKTLDRLLQPQILNHLLNPYNLNHNRPRQHHPAAPQTAISPTTPASQQSSNSPPA
jgi:hypothetical protein